MYSYSSFFNEFVFCAPKNEFIRIRGEVKLSQPVGINYYMVLLKMLSDSCQKILQTPPWALH